MTQMKNDREYNEILKELQRVRNILEAKNTIIEILQEHIKSDAEIISALYTELKKEKRS